MASDERKGFEEAVISMLARHSPYSREYVFYAHLLSQCKVIFDTTFKAAAGVSFKHSQYVLYLNPSEIVAQGMDENGEYWVAEGFNSDMPLEHRLGILKHEMLHIAQGHLLRIENRDFQLFNVASDCAINQHISREHLPSYTIYPDTLPIKNAPLMESAEVYYELLKKEAKEQEKSGGGNNKDNTTEDGELGNKVSNNAHDKWAETEGDPTLQKEFTKNMVERAAENTRKQIGCYPQGYEQMIKNLMVRREISWKQVLRRLVGNKKANTRKTIMRKNRRQPEIAWLKGKTKDRIFNLAVISDVSGSMSEEALLNVWGEVINICKLFETPVTVVQVDTEAYPPEPLTRNTKAIMRKACGGTNLYPGVEKLQEANVRIDALLVTTDGYLSSQDVTEFQQLNKPVIWLIEPNGRIMEEMSLGKMRALKLTEDYSGNY